MLFEIFALIRTIISLNYFTAADIRPHVKSLYEDGNIVSDRSTVVYV